MSYFDKQFLNGQKLLQIAAGQQWRYCRKDGSTITQIQFTGVMGSKMIQAIQQDTMVIRIRKFYVAFNSSILGNLVEPQGGDYLINVATGKVWNINQVDGTYYQSTLPNPNGTEQIIRIFVTQPA